MQQPIDFLIRAGTDEIAATLREHIARRLSFALRHFERRVRRVRVRLIDLNGPKRGVDSRCSMTLELVHGGSVVVEATTARPFTSVTRAASRLKEAVRRELTRATSHA
jgi:putative sigma-54 modulation protein